MFGIGFWELVVIALVVFIVMDPKELPEFFRRVGRAYRELVGINRKARSYYDGLCRDLTDLPNSGFSATGSGDGSKGRGKENQQGREVNDETPGR